MENMQIERQGNVLVIKVDISPEKVKSSPMSSTGKSRLVANSHGWTALSCADRMAINLTVNAK